MRLIFGIISEKRGNINIYPFGVVKDSLTLLGHKLTIKLTKEGFMLKRIRHESSSFAQSILQLSISLVSRSCSIFV